MVRLRQINPSVPARDFRSHLGVLAHRATARCLVAAGTSGDPALFRRAAVASCLASDPLIRDRRRGFLLLSGMVASYCAMYRRGPGWRLIGVESTTTSGGRVDLLFQETATRRVEADELKASPARSTWSAREWDQVHRYLVDLRQRYGKRFGGVRMVHLGAPMGVQLVRDVGELGSRPEGEDR